MRRHDTDGVSLVFGVIFCGIAALWALVAGDALGAAGLRVAVPVVLIAAGVAGVLSSLLGGRSRRDHPAGGPATRGETSGPGR